MGSFQQYYEVGPLKDYSSSTISWIPALQLFLLFALGPFVGIIYDKYGPGPLILGGSIFHVFGLMMASLAKKYYQFMLSQGVCSAIGVACLYMPGKLNLLASPCKFYADSTLSDEAIACVSTWFNKKRGWAMGILVTGSSVGGVIFPVMISRMIQSAGYPVDHQDCGIHHPWFADHCSHHSSAENEACAQENARRSLCCPFPRAPFCTVASWHRNIDVRHIHTRRLSGCSKFSGGAHLGGNIPILGVYFQRSKVSHRPALSCSRPLFPI